MSSRLALQKSRNPHLMLFSLKWLFYQNFETAEDNFRFDDFESDRIRSLPLRSDAAEQIRSDPFRSDPDQLYSFPGQTDPLHVLDPYSAGNELQNEVLSRPGECFLFSYSLSWVVDADLHSTSHHSGQSDIISLEEILVVDKDDVTLMLQISHPVLLSRTSPGI